mmetsp:Transcript_18198/g.45874  ORF Transcript_18198/g.45874 Transcript_18198/m.45874 type:complete len:329 (-) Transcript_18198:417-1403(-)
MHTCTPPAAHAHSPPLHQSPLAPSFCHMHACSQILGQTVTSCKPRSHNTLLPDLTFLPWPTPPSCWRKVPSLTAAPLMWPEPDLNPGLLLALGHRLASLARVELAVGVLVLVGLLLRLAPRAVARLALAVLRRRLRREVLGAVVGHHRARGRHDHHGLVAVVELAGHREVVGVPRHAPLASKVVRIGVERDAPLAALARGHAVALVRLVRREVEHPHKRPALRHQHLLLLVYVRHPLVGRGQELETVIQLHQRAVEATQVVVAQVVLLCQRPLAAAVPVRPVVALAGEVDPLGVTKLVAHEGEPGLAAQRHGYRADHLVHGDAALDDG